ncbi:MAG: flavodoxin [Lentimicrobiaceae bacterium]|nr:flavodoxin [Lentimicrobiaceae bacterium]
MKKTAIIYSFNTVKTAKAAEKIREAFGKEKVDLVNAEDITEKTFLSYDNLILGVPTWFDGELPNYWDEFVPALEDLDLKGKTVAIFGNGDQKGYPQNFVDGIGLMAVLLRRLGAKIVGYTSTKGYTYEASRAVEGDQFCGLALDYENQARLNGSRIKDWVAQLQKELA